MTYLLDTNAWIAFLRAREPQLIRRIRQVPPEQIALCSVVLAELIHGAHNSGPAHFATNLGLIAQLRNQFACVPFDEAAAERWGEIRHDLGRKGLLRGPHDL